MPHEKKETHRGDVFLQLGYGSLDKIALSVGNFTKRVDFGDTLWLYAKKKVKFDNSNGKEMSVRRVQCSKRSMPPPFRVPW